LYGPLEADVLTSKKWLVGGVDVQIRLIPSSKEFFFIKSVTDHHSANRIDRHLLSLLPKHEVLLAQHIAISQNMFKYADERRRNHVISLKSGSTFLQEDQMFNNVTPGKVDFSSYSTEDFYYAYAFFVFDLKAGYGMDLMNVKTKTNSFRTRLQGDHH
jgi:hypothetical protein